MDEVRHAKRKLILSGDGRANSPGHSAKYGLYSFIDLESMKMVHKHLVQVISTCYLVALKQLQHICYYDRISQVNCLSLDWTFYIILYSV
jgi:hypothetical protein